MWQASTHTHEYHEDHGLKIMSHVMSRHSSSGPGDTATGGSNAVQRTMHKRPQVSAVHFSLALRDSVEQRERAGNRKVAAAQSCRAQSTEAAAAAPTRAWPWVSCRCLTPRPCRWRHARCRRGTWRSEDGLLLYAPHPPSRRKPSPLQMKKESRAHRATAVHQSTSPCEVRTP